VLIDEWANVFSGYVELSFGDRLKALRVEGSGLPEGYLSAANVDQDKVRFAFAGAQPSSGSGRMVEVLFEGDLSDARELALKTVRLNEGGMSVVLSATASVPGEFALYPNVPNPFNPLTTIAYDLPQASHVTLTIYNLTGQRVATLVAGSQEAGHYEVVWDGSGFGNGIYFYRLETGNFAETRRMILLK